jgi:hypothetical protein
MVGQRGWTPVGAHVVRWIDSSSASAEHAPLSPKLDDINDPSDASLPKAAECSAYLAYVASL